MKGSSQTLLWIIVIAIVGVSMFFIIGVVKSIKKAKQQAAEHQTIHERNMKLLRDMEEEDRVRKEKLRIKEDANKEMVAAAFTGLIGSDRWDENLWKDPDQGKRIDRLRYDASKMNVLAYDNRYHAGLVRGTSGTHYLVSGERCNCPDFLRQKKPCKHMYFLGQYVTDHGYDFLEADYADGLKDTRAFLVGRFPGGKDAAKANLKERGCLPIEVNNSDVNLAIIGNTTAQKTIENLKAKEIRMLNYNDALQIFTSEIRHPEVC